MFRWSKENRPYSREIAQEGMSFYMRLRGILQVWMNVGDVILLSLRDFQDGRGDIILKYTADEARSLKSLGEIPENGNCL